MSTVVSVTQPGDLEDTYSVLDLFPFRLSWDIGYSSLCCIAGPCCFSKHSFWFSLGWSPRICGLKSLQVMLILLVWRQLFANCGLCFKELVASSLWRLLTGKWHCCVSPRLVPSEGAGVSSTWKRTVWLPQGEIENSRKRSELSAISGWRQTVYLLTYILIYL